MNGRDQRGPRFLFELYNTATEEVEGVESLTEAEVQTRNETLLVEGDERRWVRQMPPDKPVGPYY